MREHRVIHLDPIAFPSDTEPDENDERCEEVQQFESLATDVRNIYVCCRSSHQGSAYTPGANWDGGTSRFGRQTKPIWPRVARFIIRHGLDPVAFIRSQFWHTPKDRPPQPTDLMSEAALEKWQVYERGIEKSLSSQLSYEITSIRSEMLPLQEGLNWSHDRALKFALYNVKTVVASPLVRYCLAVEYGMDEVAEHFHDRALFQYAFQKDAYDAAWPQGSIPEALVREGRALVERILTRGG